MSIGHADPSPASRMADLAASVTMSRRLASSLNPTKGVMPTPGDQHGVVGEGIHAIGERIAGSPRKPINRSLSREKPVHPWALPRLSPPAGQDAFGRSPPGARSERNDLSSQWFLCGPRDVRSGPGGVRLHQYGSGPVTGTTLWCPLFSRPCPPVLLAANRGRRGRIRPDRCCR